MFKEAVDKLLSVEISRGEYPVAAVKADRPYGGRGRVAGFTGEVDRIVKAGRERKAAESKHEALSVMERRALEAAASRQTESRDRSEAFPVRAATDRNRISRRKAASKAGVYNKGIHERQHEAVKSENRAARRAEAGISVDGIALEVRNGQARELVAHALSEINAMLDLPSGAAFNAQPLVDFDQESLEQFADILLSLERIVALFDQAAVSGETLVFQDTEIPAVDAGVLSADLRIEKFHLQMGLSLIGAREIVSDIMADKSGEFTASGISQATDPAELGMSALDTARVFSSLIEGMERINQVKSVEAQAEGQAVPASRELQAADSQAMRAMFKNAAAATIDEAAGLDAVKPGNAGVKAEVVIDDIDVPISISELTKGNIYGGKNILGIDDADVPAGVTKLVKGDTSGDKGESKADKSGVPLSISELAKGGTSGGKNESGSFADRNPSSTNSMNTSQAQQSAASLAGDDGAQEGVAPADAMQARASAAVDGAQKASSAFSRFDNEAVIRQIMDRMHSAVRSGQGVHEIRMVLRPEALGEVRMSIRVEGDTVVAKMQVENAQVKAIVESNMQSLKDSLEEQNLRATTLSVDVRSDNDGSHQPGRGEGMEALRVHRFRHDASGMEEPEFDALAVPAGSDTGRRFGGNTFEYFV